MLVLGWGDVGRRQQAGPHADRDLVHQGAGVGSVGGVPGGALRGEQVGDGRGGAQRGSAAGGVSVHVGLAGQVGTGRGCCQVGMHWAAVLEGVGSLRNR